MINVNGLKRNAKNIVKKYSDAQVKVREATSNDPWGPSSTIMAEIADLTYNVVAFSEIMQMIWKRLNDHGKNWRHVYKALVVLEYLIKTGTEKVAQQCIENIFAIQTLKDFQYMEDNKDHGMNIREKSKKLVTLLKDSEKLKAERARAIKAKSRLAESMSSVGKQTSITSMMTNSGSGDNSATTSTNNNSNSNYGNNYLNYHNDSGSSSSGTATRLPDVGNLAILGSDLDSARPQTASEEENQLKLALALSKEEAEKQEKTRKNDELRLKLALDVSKKSASNNLLDEFPTSSSPSTAPLAPAPAPVATTSTKSTNIMDDLMTLTIPPPTQEPQNDPWSTNQSTSFNISNDPWQTLTTAITTTLTNTTTSTTLTSSISNFPPLTTPTPSNLTNLATKPAPATSNALKFPSDYVFKSKNPFED